MSGEGNIGARSTLLKYVGADVEGDGQDLVMICGSHVTVGDDDEIDLAPDLSEVLYVAVSLESDPVLTMDRVTAVPGADGKFNIKSWMPTDLTLTTPIEATTFSKIVNYVVVGRGRGGD